jgi:hypothetical protein
MGIEHVRAEIDRMRVQVGRQRKDILQLQRAGIRIAVDFKKLVKSQAAQARVASDHTNTHDNDRFGSLTIWGPTMESVCLVQTAAAQ